jgi:hypothetical protein
VIEQEAWECFERSKADRTDSRSRRRTGKDVTETAETRKQQRDGDPRWLTVILDCVARRIALLGLSELPPDDGKGYGPTALAEVTINVIEPRSHDARAEPPPDGARLEPPPAPDGAFIASA